MANMISGIVGNRFQGVKANLLDNLNFEFMDLKRTPNSLKGVLRDILQVGNSKPFRNYYDWVTKEIEQEIENLIDIHLYELGAGMAPITERMSQKYTKLNLNFIPTDLNPDKKRFQYLEHKNKNVKPIYDSFDFTNDYKIDGKSVAVLSATFHHIPEHLKLFTIKRLMKNFDRVLIFEPLRKNISSFIFVLGALVTGFLCPFFLLKKRSFFRSAFWCWVVPIAPFIFVWDGWVSSMRCWSIERWKKIPGVTIKKTTFCTMSILNSENY